MNAHAAPAPVSRGMRPSARDRPWLANDPQQRRRQGRFVTTMMRSFLLMHAIRIHQSFKMFFREPARVHGGASGPLCGSRSGPGHGRPRQGDRQHGSIFRFEPAHHSGSAAQSHASTSRPPIPISTRYPDRSDSLFYSRLRMSGLAGRVSFVTGGAKGGRPGVGHRARRSWDIFWPLKIA